jgi:hypothetical protein
MGGLERGMIDASDKRLLAWLAELPSRQELVVRMALNGRSKNQGRDWDAPSFCTHDRTEHRYHGQDGRAAA